MRQCAGVGLCFAGSLTVESVPFARQSCSDMYLSVRARVVLPTRERKANAPSFPCRYPSLTFFRVSFPSLLLSSPLSPPQIKKKRQQKPHERDAARDAALREAKERKVAAKKSKDAAKKNQTKDKVAMNMGKGGNARGGSKR